MTLPKDRTFESLYHSTFLTKVQNQCTVSVGGAGSHQQTGLRRPWPDELSFQWCLGSVGASSGAYKGLRHAVGDQVPSLALMGSHNHMERPCTKCGPYLLWGGCSPSRSPCVTLKGFRHEGGGRAPGANLGYWVNG